MNKLNELIEQQKFKEIISLYADSKDIEEMFAYALALAIEGDAFASNEYFKKHYEILIKQPVRLINSHVNIFLYLGQFKNAKEVVEFYEEKPYISQEVEAALAEAGLTTQEFAGVVIQDLKDRETEVDNDGNEIDIENSETNYLLDKGINTQHNLAYTEFISLNTNQIQKLKAEPPLTIMLAVTALLKIHIR